jgi:hypothetical protein
MNLRSLLKRWFDKAQSYLENLNLFSTDDDEDLHEIYNQILSTRLYIIFLTLG